MSELFRVVANEWMKLIHRLRLWVTVGLAILIVTGISLLHYFSTHSSDMIKDMELSIQDLEHRLQDAKKELARVQKGAIDTQEEFQLQAEVQQYQQDLQSMKQQLADEKQLRTGDWQTFVKKQIAQIQQSMNEVKGDKDELKVLEAEIKKWQYYLDHNIRPVSLNEPTAYRAMTDLMMFMLAIFVPMLVIVLVGDIVSGETTSGTIKLLLVRPVSRLKIMLGKWLVVVVATIMLVVGFFAALYGINMVLFEKSGGDQVEWVGVTYKQKAISAQDPAMQEQVTSVPVYAKAKLVPILEIYWTGCGLAVISMIAVATITFLFSTLFKSSMVSTGVSLAVVIVGNIATQIIANGKYLSWLFSVHINLVLNWTGDLSRHFGTNLSLEFGILVLAIWTIASLISAIVYFQRKDILNA